MPPPPAPTAAAPPLPPTIGRHWIITNRRVNPGAKTGHDVDTSKNEALEVFRVASFDAIAALKGSNPKTGPTDDALLSAVSFFDDTAAPDYSDAAAATIADVKKLPGTVRMFREVYDRMAAWAAVSPSSDAPPHPNDPAPKGDTLFFIHGFNYSWPDALRNLLRLHELYAAAPESPVSQVVFFSWPSIGRQDSYPSDQEVAVPSGVLLGRVFGKTVKFYRRFFGSHEFRGRHCGKKMHLGAHSMGNQVLREFIRSIAGVDHLKSAIFGETLLLNADVEWQALEGDQPLHQLPEYCERIHVYNHRSDDALSISELTKNVFSKRLGKYGPRELDLICPRTVIVDGSRLGVNTGRLPSSSKLEAAARRILGGKLSDRERLFDHWGYLHREQVVSDIWQVLRGVPSSSVSGRDRSSEKLYRLVD